MTQNEPLVAIGPEPKETEEARLRRRMAGIRRKLVVVSGKRGVGKSTAAANLAVSLASQGHNVGLLDADIHGPSTPKLLGCEGTPLRCDEQTILPVAVREPLTVMSIGFLVANKTDAVIWRGAMKFKALQQLLGDVAWGDLDYLVIDCPPGTGDEPLSVAQLIGRPAAAVVVTTPQELAIADVRRCVTFCRMALLPVAGVLENMSGYACPHCGVHTDLFGAGGGERLSREMAIPFLGQIPIDPRIAECGDRGEILIDTDPQAVATQTYLTLASRLHANEELWGRK